MVAKIISLKDLRKIIYTSWYGKSHQNQYDMCWGEGKACEDWLSRELIIKEINDCHKLTGTIYFH